MIEVVLDAADVLHADAVGRARNAEHRSVGRADGRVGDDSVALDIQGARAEKAVSKGLGLFWDGAFFKDEVWQRWRVIGHDVGKLEVRSIDEPQLQLIIHESDPDLSPFVSVLVRGQVCLLRGWCFGKDGKKKAWFKDVGRQRPCFFVPITMLQPMETLIAPRRTLWSGLKPGAF